MTAAEDDVFLPKQLRPRSLQDFGYGFNEELKLRHLATDAPYVFLSQKHYDLLGDALVEHLYHVMEEQPFCMRRLMLPVTEPGDVQPQAPVFISANASRCSTVLLICQGSGAVRPGMWARALCMNDSLERGSILPYLRDAAARDWGVVVLNPNENSALVAGNAEEQSESDTAGREEEQCSVQRIREEFCTVSKSAWLSECASRRSAMQPIAWNSSPEDHMQYVYGTVLPQYFPNATKRLIVAHSYGGRCVTALLRHHLAASKRRSDDDETTEAFQRLVPAIALTDAINDLRRSDHSKVKRFFRTKVINWVASDAPLDTVLPLGSEGSVELSAGHTDHIHTSESCRTSVFAFFDRVLKSEALQPEAPEASC